MVFNSRQASGTGICSGGFFHCLGTIFEVSHGHASMMPPAWPDESQRTINADEPTAE
jgi:hypothetical protein